LKVYFGVEIAGGRRRKSFHSKVPEAGLEPARPLRSLDFESNPRNPEPANTQQVTETANPVLPSGLPESLENDADFARLMDRWPSLPARVKQTILTLVASVPNAGD